MLGKSVYLSNARLLRTYRIESLLDIAIVIFISRELLNCDDFVTNYWLVACKNRPMYVLHLWFYLRSVAVLYVCCASSDVTRWTLFMELYLGRMCLGKLHAVRCSNMGTLMCLFAAQSLSTAWSLFVCQYICEMILVILYLMVWDWPFQEQGQCLLISQAAHSILSLTVLSFSSFIIWVGIVRVGSLDWLGIFHSLPAFHCQSSLIIIL